MSHCMSVTRPLHRTNGRKQLACPTCRAVCKVKAGRAGKLLRNFAVMDT